MNTLQFNKKKSLTKGAAMTIVIIIATLLIIPSCNSLAKSDQEPVIVIQNKSPQSANKLKMTTSGVSSLVLDEELPNSVAGLYSNIVETQKLSMNWKERITELYLDDVHIGSIIINPDARRAVVGIIEIYTPTVSIANGIHPGMSIQEAFKVDGFFASLDCDDKKEVFSCRMASGIDGDWFSFIPIMVEWFDTNMLSEKGMAKLKSIEPHSGGISLNADDFNDNVVIPCIVLESIGMGL